MCGIFGYVGKRQDAAKIVFDGLKSLEYRGYDSWGIAAGISNFKFQISNREKKKQELLVDKHIGKLPKQNPNIVKIKSNSSLGHTRWATHGGVTDANAHPHLDCSGKIAVVHNGIVENYLEIKKSLSKKHHFKSETDTEVVVHLVEELSRRFPLEEAVRQAFLKLRGLNAFIFIKEGGEIVAVKNGSPLVVGIGKGENFIASDPSALIPKTRKAIFIGDNQLVVVRSNQVELKNLLGKKISSKVQKLDWEVEEVALGKFKHYMIKEIYDQPKVLRTITGNGNEISKVVEAIGGAKETFFIGCGTASYAALAGSYLFSSVSKQHVNFSVGSEFNYLEHYLNSKSLVIAISQSGETIDVVQPAQKAKEKGARVAALTNVVGSSLYRLADYKIMLSAGVERAVCATKTFSAMVANIIYLTFAVKGQISQGKKLILDAAEATEKILEDSYVLKIKKLASKLKGVNDIYVIGRGISYAAALEATLKLKEVPYIHSEGFAGGELKHGVIALVEKGTPCIVFAPNDETYSDIISNAIEIKSRGGYIIGVSPKENDVFDYHLPVADIKEASLIVNTVPIQLLAYYIALEKGLDPDKPRNLAKSVTVK